MGQRVEPRLTICTASFHSKACLDLSWTLTTRLNEARDFRWLVVENTDLKSPDRFSQDDQRFTVVEGVQSIPMGRSHGSYWHAAALHKALEMVSTRFVLVLDPDFFIVRPNWIGEVLDHVIAQELSFFGAPYHPARYTKYRYFPHVACLMVDLERIDKSDLDFTPETVEMQALRSLTLRMLIVWTFTGRKPPLLEPHVSASRMRALQLLPANLARRLLMGRVVWPDVGISRDTGYRIYRKFARNTDRRSECVIPVWKRPSAASPSSLKTSLARMIQEIDGYLTAPKRKDYYARHGFREYGVPDIAGIGWEEYMWKAQPFGFHIRGLFHGAKSVEYPALASMLSQLGNTDGTSR